MQPPLCLLLECARCGHRFFDERSTPGEPNRLYSGYREEAYLACRHNHEPWCTRAVNRYAGWDDGLVASRTEGIAAFLGTLRAARAVRDRLRLRR